MPSNGLPSADKALNSDAYFRLYQGALRIEDRDARLVACTVILVAGRLGLRLQEIQHLREEWIDWRRGEIHIPAYDPCGCKRCWLTALDTWGRRGLKELQESGEWESGASWKDLRAAEREEVVQLADYCTPENLEEVLYSERWQPKYDRSARVVPFGWSERITACLMAFFDRYDYVEYQQFPVNRLIRRAAKNADGLDPEEISAHPLRATGLTFLADISTDAKMLRDLAGWQDIGTAVRYLRVSGRITSHKLYHLMGKGDEAPPVVPSEPEYRFPVVSNPIPFENEPFAPVTPDGVYCDQDVRLARHHEQRGEPIPLLHPRAGNVPHNRAGFPAEDQLSYDPSRHDLTGHLARDSDRVRIEDGRPVTVATTLAEIEDVHRLDPEEYPDPEAHRADTQNARLSDYLDEDRDGDVIPAVTVTGAAVLTAGATRSRLGREWSEFWLAGDGAAPSAERLAMGTAAYLLLVVLPLSLNLSLLVG